MLIRFDWSKPFLIRDIYLMFLFVYLSMFLSMFLCVFLSVFLSVFLLLVGAPSALLCMFYVFSYL